jgi:hypothetical protein
MSAQETVRELLDRDPFEPFRILTSGGESFIIRDPHTVALMKSQVFIAHPNTDRWTYVPWLHVSAVDRVANGRRNGHPRRGRRKRRG